MAYDLFIPVLIATLTFMVTPGPGSLYSTAQSLADGRQAGLKAALGLHVGGYVHVIAASLGLAIVLELVPMLFTLLKFIGAAFLIWLGIGLLRTRLTGHAPTLLTAPTGSFWQAVWVEVLNPKTALFFLAFLPQFVSPEASLPVPLQFLIVGMGVSVAFSLVDVIYALAAGALHARLAGSTRIAAWTKRAGGAILMGLGLHLTIMRST